MIPTACPCTASRYVKEVIKISEWVRNEKSGLNLLSIEAVCLLWVFEEFFVVYVLSVSHLVAYIQVYMYVRSVAAMVFELQTWNLAHAFSSRVAKYGFSQFLIIVGHLGLKTAKNEKNLWVSLAPPPHVQFCFWNIGVIYWNKTTGKFISYNY